MKTEKIQAYTVEAGDTLTDGDNLFTVREVNDTEQVEITIEDEEGWANTTAYDPFEEVTLYLGEDDVEFEDVEADPE